MSIKDDLKGMSCKGGLMGISSSSRAQVRLGSLDIIRCSVSVVGEAFWSFLL